MHSIELRDIRERYAYLQHIERYRAVQISNVQSLVLARLCTLTTSI